jgi:TolA-binding protein
VEAAQWFDTYLREQPQGLLAREAAGRLIESYRASGNASAAQTAAARYLARYPHGPHASLARQALTARGD